MEKKLTKGLPKNIYFWAQKHDAAFFTETNTYGTCGTKYKYKFPLGTKYKYHFLVGKKIIARAWTKTRSTDLYAIGRHNFDVTQKLRSTVE